MELSIRAKCFIDLELFNTKINWVIISTFLNAFTILLEDKKLRKEWSKGKGGQENRMIPMETLDFYTPLNMKFPTILVEMEKQDLA